jgi:hypothetical protein
MCAANIQRGHFVASTLRVPSAILTAGDLACQSCRVATLPLLERIANA